MTRQYAHRLMFAILLICQFSICLATERADPNDPNRYLDAVREFADNVLKYGRDTYGPKHKPLFVDGLNIHTYEPVKWIDPDGTKWVLSNLASQQTLLRTLDGLSQITADTKYREAAVQAIRYAFEHLLTPNGLLYWGHAAAYDASADKVRGQTHCLKLDYPYYELMWQVDPATTKRLVEAFWSAHIIDWSNLDMKRSAPINQPLEEPWAHEYKGGAVFFESAPAGGLSFSSTGSALAYAGAILHRLTNNEEPLVWSKRLAHRYVETRDLRTGISAHVYNRAPGSKVSIRRFPMDVHEDKKYYPEHSDAQPWMCMFLVGDMLDGRGGEFAQWALEELTAWAKATYRKEDNSFVPMLADGTCLVGHVDEGSEPIQPISVDPLFFWAYALAYRITGDSFMWEMTRNIAKGNGLGDIGEIATDIPELQTDTSSSDVSSLLAFLELYAGTEKQGYLEIAKRIGDNILESKFTKGFFVGSRRHIYARLDCFEPLAFLNLHAAIHRRQRLVPRVWPSIPLFVLPYRHKSKGNDLQMIYTLTDFSEPPVSLQEAAAIGNVGLVQSLLEKGTHVDSLDDTVGMTALHRAATSGHKDVVELLIAKGARTDVRDAFPGGTALHYAAENGHKEIAELLMANGADANAIRGYPAGDTPLHFAIRAGHKEIIDLLIAKKANVNAKNEAGQTPIDIALQRRRWDIVKDLIDAGTDVNHVNADGQTPLHIAARRNQKDLAETLLDKGSDVNLGDNKGQTPLHMAAEGGHKEIIELLLARGARIDAKDHQEFTPALTALYEWSLPVTILLLGKGADATCPPLAAYTGDLSRIQNILDANSAGDDYKGLTLLHTAAAGGRVELVNYLIGKGFDVKATTEDGLTPLHYAAMGNHRDIAEILIEEGTPVDTGETTPLFIAAQAGHKDMVQYLISKGTDINKGPQTSIHRAVDWWEMDAVKLLL